MSEKGKISDEDKCRIAWEITFDQAMSICGWEKIGKEEVFKSMGNILGMTEKEANDISEKCSDVLERKITEEFCYDFKETRQWVMCNTWKLMNEKRIKFSDAMKQSWEELKKKCSEVKAKI